MRALALLRITGLSMATAVPESLKARIPPGVIYTSIAPEDIPGEIKGVNSTLSPSEAPTVEGRDLQKRVDLGVYLCNDANWSGYCVHIVAPDNVCGTFEVFFFVLHSRVNSLRCRSPLGWRLE